MATGSVGLRNDEVMEIHKSLVSLCKKSKEFKEHFLENGICIDAKSPYSCLDMVNEDEDEYEKLLSKFEKLGIGYNVEEYYFKDDEGSIYDSEGIMVLDSSGKFCTEGKFYEDIWKPEPDDSEGVYSISYPSELIFSPIVTRNLMYTSDESDSYSGYSCYIYMGVASDVIDFNLFAPNIVDSKYKWSTPNKLEGNWHSMIQEMYLSSGKDLPMSVYDNVVIKISMVESELCFTFYASDPTEQIGGKCCEVIHYHEIGRDLVVKMLSKLPVGFNKIKEVYIVYADYAEDSLNNYIVRKCDDGEYVLTLF